MPRPLRHLGNPILTAAAALSLVLLLHHHCPSYHTSNIGSGHRALALELLGIEPSTRNYNVFSLAIDNARLLDRAGRIVLEPAQPWDEPPAPDEATILAEIHFRGHHQISTTGLFADSLIHHPHTLEFTEHAPLTPDQRAHARVLFAKLLRAHPRFLPPTSPVPDLIVAGDGVHTILNPRGLAIDALAATLALLALASYAAKPHWLRAAARRRTPPPGVCPTCRYDLTGLPPSTTTCPECGHSPPPT